MRMIVSCPNCSLQYDAKGRPAGTRFRCRCGDILEVKLPHGHDASVIRCSACGGARKSGETSCSYCQARFTIHERDLHTICPSCMARISDKARFCHYCAQSIQPEWSTGEDTESLCPTCPDEQHLSYRSMGESGIAGLLECQTCAGVWMRPQAFESLEQDAAQAGRLKGASIQSKPAGGPSPLKQRGPIYRKCPDCSRIMNRTNYGRMSGIIIDVCKDHGIWFDAHELDSILRWVKDGGLETAAAKQYLKEADELRRLKSEAQARAMTAKQHYQWQTKNRGVGSGVLDVWDIVEMVGRAFKYWR